MPDFGPLAGTTTRVGCTAAAFRPLPLVQVDWLRRFLLNYILPSIVRAQKDSLKGQEQLSIMLATRPPCEKVPERLPEAPKTQHGMYSSLPCANLDASVDPSSPFICVHLWHGSRPIQRTECHLHISAMQDAAPFVPSSLVPGRQMVARLRSAECAIMCRRRAQGQGEAMQISD